jgi:hypothetical protein
MGRGSGGELRVEKRENQKMKEEEEQEKEADEERAKDVRVRGKDASLQPSDGVAGLQTWAPQSDDGTALSASPRGGQHLRA